MTTRSVLSPTWWLLILLASVTAGWLATQKPMIILIFGMIIISLTIVNMRSTAWLVLFTIGIHFDDLFIPLGFAKVGFGDFSLLLLIAYWTSQHIQVKRRALYLPEMWPLLVMYAVGVGVSWQLGPNPQAITGLYIRNCLYVLGYFLLVDLLVAQRGVKLFLWITLLSVVCHALIALVIDNPDARLDGLVGQPNIFGGLIGTGAIIGFLFSTDSTFKPFTRILLMITSAMIMFVLLLTVSRGAQLAFLLAMLWAYRDRLKLISSIAILGGLVAGAVTLLEPDRFAYFINRWTLEDGSVSSRQTLIMNALQVIVEYPFFGVGFSQFVLLEDVLAIDEGRGKASHNHYLGELATLGIPTALALFTYIFIQAKQLWALSHSTVSRLMSKQSSRIYVTMLQSLMIFQSVALIFRGGRRMIEWSFLALYTAAIMIDQIDRKNSPKSTPIEPAH